MVTGVIIAAVHQALIMEPDMRLEGKVALISGAASGVEGDLMGFGGAAARLFAREGAKVVLTDINQKSGQQTAAQINESGGGTLWEYTSFRVERW